MVEVVVCAVAFDDKGWSMKRVSERTISEEPYLLSRAYTPPSVSLQIGFRISLFITSPFMNITRTMNVTRSRILQEVSGR
jgi:hypothetical protein